MAEIKYNIDDNNPHQYRHQQVNEPEDTPLMSLDSASNLANPSSPPPPPHDHSHSKLKSGTTWTAISHIITALIGAGVLSLSWSVAQLGWVGGILLLIFYAAITTLTNFFISDLYRSPDPQFGPTINSSYLQAIRHFLGVTMERICGVLVQENLCGSAIAYIITASSSVRAIRKSDCYHKEGHQASCSEGENISYYMLLFGGVQLVMSQIPDLHNMEWLSVLAAIMSFAYAIIGTALGLAKVIGNKTIKGSITGVPASTRLKKLSLVFQALGDIAFAFPYSVLVLDIQDTLKSPPPENQTMKKATFSANLITIFFYLFCGGFGYAAFGDDTPGNILSGFGFYEPYWLVDFANACVVVHLVGGYQMYSQPVFAFVEGWFTSRWPDSRFVKHFYGVKLPFLPVFRVNLLRICFRTAYVASTTAVAILFPYFNQVLGVLGALNFWPLTIYFPVEMYMIQKQIGGWTRKGILLRTFTFVCLLMNILALIGSIQGIVSEKLS